jgi:hypothetical protein
MALLTTIYLYDQKIDLKLPTATDRQQWEYEMYNHTIRLYKGIDNDIQVSVRNDNQKKLPIGGFNLIFNLIDNIEDTGILLSKSAVITDPIKGFATLTITEGELMNIEPQLLNYSIKVVDGESNSRVGFVDGAYDVVGQIEVRDGLYPTLIDSQILTNDDFSEDGGIYTSETLPGDAKLNQNTGLHTAAFYVDNYTGSIDVQATLNPSVNPPEEDFFIVKTISLTAESGIHYTNWNGMYNQIRFVHTPTTGQITQILYRS